MAAPSRWSAHVPWIVAVAGSALVVSGALLLSSREQKLQRAQLDQSAENEFRAIDRVHQSRLLYQYGLNGFFAAASNVSLDQLYDHVLKVEADRPLTGVIGYVPLVRAGQRSGFEADIQHKLRLSYRIWESGTAGAPRPAPQRTRYLPVTHLWPLTGNEKILGFDLWSDPALRAAMERAVASGGPARSDPVPLLLDENRPLGYFAFIPLYSRGSPPASLQARWQRLEGFTVGIFRFGSALEQGIGDGMADQHSVYTYNSRGPSAQPVHRYEPDARFDGSTAVPSDIGFAATSSMTGAWVADVDVAGKPLTYVFVPVHPATWWSAFGRSGLPVMLVGLPCVALLVLFLRRRDAGVADLHRRGAIHQAVVETSLDVYVLLDDQGRVLEWNPRAEQLFGWPAETVLGTPLATVLMSPTPEAGQVPLDRLLADASHSPEGATCETVALSRDGTELHLQIALNATRVDRDLRFVAFIRDIGDRRKSERELEQLSLLAAKTTNAMAVLDLRGRITWINDGFAQAFGYQLPEVRGRVLYDVLAGRSTRQEHIESISRGLQGRQSFRQEIQLHSKAGAEMWFDMDFTPVAGPDGELRQVLAVGTDISARKRTERQVLR
ncbi:MAG TPA: PAS domain S-box protein, partial [Candidatus Binatia bacterium]|nr:PAS domain S-box protein [Candidatus Binatia bacterium]